MCDSSEKANVAFNDLTKGKKGKEEEKVKSGRLLKGGNHGDGGMTRMKIGGKVGPMIHGSALSRQA